MTALSASQRQDVVSLLTICDTRGVDAVMIGATAYRLLFPDRERYTLDIDLALAVELDDWTRFEEALTAQRWQRSSAQEPRWTTPSGNRFDLIPAGPRLRTEGRLVWPRTGFVMSLVGFDQVFRRAVVQDLGDGLAIKSVTASVLALLKIVAYMDSPELRAKDLDDLRDLLRWYESDSDRVFSDVVIDADLPDVEFASAFLLGLDIGAIADATERQLVGSFLKTRIDPALDTPTTHKNDWNADESLRFQYQLRAFSQGFRQR